MESKINNLNVVLDGKDQRCHTSSIEQKEVKRMHWN
jgi:hypothetical protein